MSDNGQKPKGKRKILVETQVPRDLPFLPDGAGDALSSMKINPQNKMQQEPEAKKTQQRPETKKTQQRPETKETPEQ